MMIPKKRRNEILKMKLCGFPGCQTQEFMTGKGKFCKEHRNVKYRKSIDFEKNELKKLEEQISIPNKIIKHEYIDTQHEIHKCELPGCTNEFEISIIPKIYIYPRFCHEHRNEWKRKQYVEMRIKN